MKFTPKESDLRGGYITEAGEYSFKITKVSDVIASSGTQGIEIGLACLKTGNAMRETFWMSEKAAWRVCNFLIAMGVRIRRGDDVEIDDSYIGKEFKATVKMGEPKNGIAYPEIDDFDDGPHGHLFYPDGEELAAPTQAAPAPDKAIEDEGGDEW